LAPENPSPDSPYTMTLRRVGDLQSFFTPASKASAGTDDQTRSRTR
jgi:hypothetical protein